MSEKVKVLVVDDEEQFTETLAERLTMRDYFVQKAFGGEEALANIAKDPPDVVILDVLMPGMDGIETLRQIKFTHPLIEVLMLTGHATVQTAIDGLKLGAFDYLMKPMETDLLVEKINKARARKAEQEDRIRQAEIEHIVTTRGW